MEEKKKRRHERYDITLETSFRAEDWAASNFILNISLGGLCMESNRPVEPGSRVHVIIPASNPTKINGTVIWCKKDGLSYKLGIQFEKLAPHQEQAVNEVMSSFFWKDQLHD